MESFNSCKEHKELIAEGLDGSHEPLREAGKETITEDGAHGEVKRLHY